MPLSSRTTRPWKNDLSLRRHFGLHGKTIFPSFLFLGKSWVPLNSGRVWRVSARINLVCMGLRRNYFFWKHFNQFLLSIEKVTRNKGQRSNI
jgi:hypothetical protein